MSRVILTAVALFGFGTSPQTAPAAKPQPPPACATINAQDIGKLPLTLEVGGVKVELKEWKTRAIDSAATESVGFGFSATGPMTWVAELGAHRGFTGTSTDFIDELALVKADAPTLSRITFCAAST